MKSNYVIDRKYRLVALRQTGDLDLSVARENFEDIFSDADFIPGLNLLVDLSDLRQNSVNYGSILQNRAAVAALLAPFQGGRIAACFSSLTEYGVGRQWHSALDDGSMVFQEFMDLKKAMAWLDLPEGYSLDFGPSSSSDRRSAGQ